MFVVRMRQSVSVSAVIETKEERQMTGGGGEEEEFNLQQRGLRSAPARCRLGSGGSWLGRRRAAQLFGQRSSEPPLA